jgi:PAS domain S-box-containing protein
MHPSPTSPLPEQAAGLAALVMQTVRDALVVTDGDGRVTCWNDGAARVFGVSAEAMLGRQLIERLPEHVGTTPPHLQAMLDGVDWDGECEDVRKDGAHLWLDARVRRLQQPDGMTVGVVGIAQDITPRKTAEAAERTRFDAGRQNGERRRDALDAAGAAVERRRTEDALLWHNRILELISRGTPLGETLAEVVQMVEAQLPGSICSVLLLDDTGCLRVGAARSLPADYNAAIEGQPIGPSQGSCGASAFFGRTVVSNDIATDDVWRGFSQFALSHGLRSCVSVPILASGNVPGIVSGRVLGTFAVYRRETGPPDPHAFAIVAGAQVGTGDPGASVDRSTHALAVAGAAHLARAAIERGLAQQAVRDSEERFRNVLDAAPALVYLKDLEGRYQFVNRQVVEWLGLPHHEWIGRTARELVSADTADQFERNDQVVRETLRPHQVEETGTAADGRQITVLSTRFPLFRANGEPYAICGIATDITDRKAAQQERDYLWNNSPDPVCIAGFDGYLQHLNPAWTQRLGWTAEELKAEPWLTFVHPDDVEATKAAGQRLLQGERLYGFVNRYRVKDGSYRWFSWNAIPFPAQQTIYAFTRDITEERRLAEQIRQAQKMEAIGQLAGGVAHDFNNLLTVINGYTALLLDEEPALSPRRELLAEVRDAGERAAALTAQLLAFSRKAIVEPKVLDLNEATVAAFRLLRRLVGEDVRLEANFASSLPKIRIDPGQLEQVLMNLVVNARDAMPTGGLLRVTTKETLLPVALTGDSADTPSGRYVRLIVTDTGVGMSDAVKSHLFEPFFTTKGIGKGTGLGLATVYGIVRQAGGTVLVDSEVGRGTSFHVLFPALECVDETPLQPSAPLLPRGHETVLIVEDEDAVRRFARVSLQMQGYRVHEAASAREALSMDATTLSQVALLITDVVMPAIGGRQLAGDLRRRWPGIRVLYISGYTDDAVVRHGLEAAADAFLQKPFTPQGLARKVRDVLDGGHAAAPGI